MCTHTDTDTHTHKHVYMVDMGLVKVSFFVKIDSTKYLFKIVVEITETI